MIRIAQIAGTAALTLLVACSGPSSADLAKYAEACSEFYKDKRGKFSDEVEMRKHWMKGEKVVVALAVKDSKWSSSYREELCIVDPGEGTVSLPSMFDRARWSE